MTEKKYNDKKTKQRRQACAKYKKTPEAIIKNRIRAQKHRDDIRNKVFIHYGYQCACCGENEIEFLTIDHINGGGKKHRKTHGGRGFYRWLINNNYPEGFRTLCYNCNCACGKIHNSGTCPHQKNKKMIVENINVYSNIAHDLIQNYFNSDLFKVA